MAVRTGHIVYSLDRTHPLQVRKSLDIKQQGIRRADRCRGRNEPPWKKRRPFSLRGSVRNRVFSSLCRYFGISRPTGYKWLERFEITGERGAGGAKSRAPCISREVDGRGPAIAHPRTAGAAPHVGAGRSFEKGAGDCTSRHGVARRGQPSATSCGAKAWRIPDPRAAALCTHEDPLRHAQGPNDVLVCGLQSAGFSVPTASAAIR